jgi:hypothetical protein
MSHATRPSFVSLLVVSVAAALCLVGCGSDKCSDAADKAEECGLEAPEVSDDDPQCTGEVECNAQCIRDACTCEDLEGTGAEASEKCMQCLLDCATDEE